MKSITQMSLLITALLAGCKAIPPTTQDSEEQVAKDTMMRQILKDTSHRNRDTSEKAYPSF